MPGALRSSTARRWIVRVVAGAAAVVLILVVVGAAYQRVAEARDRAAVPPPGTLLTVNNGAMHLYCTGQGAPTVILEAGATGFAQTWGWIQPEVAKYTRVCSYDRAGMGWSEVENTDHDAVAIAHNLKALMEAAGESHPYVLVGHSLGGSLAQAFFGLYPDDVAGLAMIDPSHPDQLERFGPEIAKQQESFQSMIGFAASLSHVGLLRATNALGRLAKGLPERDYRTARMFAASPRHLATSHAEMLAWDETMSAARRVTSFEDRPVLVVSATAAMQGMPESMLATNHELHAELSSLSSAGRHVKVDGADHYSLLMQQDHAATTAAMIVELLEDVRNEGVSIGESESAQHVSVQ